MTFYLYFLGFETSNIYSDPITEQMANMAALKQQNIQNQLVVENTHDGEDIPLINEIFLIDPITNQVHSVIRQIIPSGNQDVGEMAVQQLKDHLEKGSKKTVSPRKDRSHESLRDGSEDVTKYA